MQRAKPGMPLWTLIAEPAAELPELGERRQARLLSLLLIALLASGLLSGVLQLWLIEGFMPTFRRMALALSGVGVAYMLSRTTRYRAAAWLTAAMVIAACMAVGAQNPEDRVWYAFMLIAVLVGAAFLRLRAAIAVACMAAAGVAVTVMAVPALWPPARWLPALMLHGVLSPLILLLFRQHERAQQERGEQLRARERQLFEAKRLEALGSMASGVAHDFNNLLSVALVGAEELRRRRAFDEAIVDDMCAACEQAAGLVSQLQAFARGQEASPRAVDLDPLLRRLQPILRRLVGPDVVLKLELAAALPSIEADPAGLEQIVLNLVLNARDAMPEGGTLTVAAARVGADDASGSHSLGPDSVALRVTDTGTGMDEATRESVFEPFFTTKKETGGTGLGLAIVQRIALQWRGKLRVESAPGAGSTFEIVFPGRSGERADSAP